MNKPRIYIAGPMSGLAENNYPAFNAVATQLREEFGDIVDNPAENPEPPSRAWRDYMRLALRQIAGVHCVVFLPGWEHSRGARVEHFLAVELSMERIYLTNSQCTDLDLRCIARILYLALRVGLCRAGSLTPGDPPVALPTNDTMGQPEQKAA